MYMVMVRKTSKANQTSKTTRKYTTAIPMSTSVGTMLNKNDDKSVETDWVPLCPSEDDSSCESVI
jgi:hypothetical protein